MNTDVAFNTTLPKLFLKMVDRPDLQCDPPSQYSKSWDNNGKPGTARILQFDLTGIPCEIKFSLFFDRDDVFKTGVQIKFRDQVIINEVLRGDALGYMHSKSIDPIAFLKKNYATTASEPSPGTATESFKLAVNDDSEDALLRAVELLTGKTQDEIRQIWAQLVAGNSDRLGKDQVSPFLNIWLKKERLRLDLAHLKNAQLLTPRLEPVTEYVITRGTTERTYRILATRLTGADIRQKIGAADPKWWGPAFYCFENGRFLKITPEQNEIENRIRKLGSDMEYEVEEIYVDGRHIFSAIIEGQTKTMVFRPRPHSFSLSELSAAESPAPVPANNAFQLAHHEKLYIEALRKETPDIDTCRKAYMKALYESDPLRFNNQDQFRHEMVATARQATKKDLAALMREELSLNADLLQFFQER